MKGLLNKFYLSSPFIVKRLMANIEAIRRDKYRRTDITEHLYKKNLQTSTSDFNLGRIKNLIYEAATNVEYYSFLSNYKVNSRLDFEKIPLLRKQVIRESKDSLKSKKIKKKKELWVGSSSGSTGTPLEYYRDKNSTNIERSQYDEFYKYCGCDTNSKRVRISSVKITRFDREKPPYWIYIDKYKQLQCSAYHISKKTYKDYLKVFKKTSPTFATGFPSAWTALADLMIEDKISFNGFSAIITDSEGLSNIQREKIEMAFNCPVYQTYGLGEVGMCAVECSQGHYHILPSHYVEIVDNKGKKVDDHEEGEIVVTDLFSSRYPFIRYATGDLGIMSHEECGCGIKTAYLTKVLGRIEDYILTKDGRKVTRITKIMKPAIGIKESQIIQTSKDEIIINVVPNDNFDERSMNKVVEGARELVGEMIIKWNVVEKLERMPSGKLKFLIRKI